ncbi:Zinc finger protein [Komagataella phaffii CBS 7435]|uniref:Basic zinc-finger protein n=2 Tax=Komagataella phaffii TaxID=460519 RepID=C4R0R9_KOMPG|nr:Basic zinc-finger protein [Komagataella phaffii GS115]AOA62770.1 GQ67_00509T0 [Komagataella phaffii]CAH2448387.1 Zinc finger protein [Komagataella phaffii CBS 7435]AOA67671.1 GQ68_00879T0 [Komagataella phaffii GS115]CAY69093.1 Basic zinc-finger protein [Komagataella phaffii GS115]CCA38513.1 Zinc finger protein [Komagataella phaffii CBS 7435]
MAKAEFGTPKYVANQMKARGLQKLRHYCQVCEKQCRDDNGFKCHVQSESHTKKVQQLSLEGGDNKKRGKIAEFSSQFVKDFIHLLRSGHGDKFVGANRFYQEYIQDKQHIHMNATRWSSLTVFVSYLGQEGLCRVKQDDAEGLMIAYIDRSAAAERRRKEAQKQMRKHTDEELAMRQLEEKIRAKRPREEAPLVPLGAKNTGEDKRVSVSLKPATETTSVKLNMKSSHKKIANVKPINVFKRKKTDQEVGNVQLG